MLTLTLITVYFDNSTINQTILSMLNVTETIYKIYTQVEICWNQAMYEYEMYTYVYMSNVFIIVDSTVYFW